MHIVSAQAASAFSVLHSATAHYAMHKIFYNYSKKMKKIA
jgi:hypothetical protein